MRAFALVGKIHFEAEKDFVLAVSEKSNVNHHSALKGKGLIWIWILIFNTAVSWDSGKLYVTCSACAMLGAGGQGSKYCCTKKRRSASAYTVVSGFTPIQVIDGSNISTYSSISCFVSFTKAFFPLLPHSHPPVVFVPCIFPHFIS